MSSAITREMDVGVVCSDLGELEVDRSITAVRPPTRPKLPSLTGSRFWAAFLVFLFHASLPSDLAPYADPTTQRVFAAIVSKAGWLGVSYFFILSGFIMVWSAKDNDTVGDFYLRRFAKIYPTHCLTWVLAFVVGAVSVGEYKLWSSNLLLVNTWVDDVKYFFVANRPSWSLCIEAFFYMLFPVLYKGMKLIPEKFDLLGLVTAVAASLLVQTCIYLWVEPNHMMGAFQISQRQFWASYIFPPPRLFEFVAGMFAARLLIHGRAPSLSKAASLALLLVTYIVAMFIPFQFGMSVVYIIPVSLLIVSIARDDLEARKTVLSGETSVWLGEISYAFYMVHFLVLFFFLNLVSGKKFSLPEGSALIAVALILSVTCASFVYRYFEVPMMKKILHHYRSRG
ncbi:acyltransferase family protein [Burkholderia ubonensis]|uniref:acyltransferase family protein n=1 Tax=Burkholderia ubonensis TaxID=101571 RepID=UPI000751B0C9|nr:acyltransferase [Burkholderia ubonensis]KVC98426.1 acyltransferase [Burkholderia ubonensis]KVD01007.1 acyltransferase [Burkholderia ubonensis]KVD61945.1 acyltransferase [Burkholderia ubonensis]KVD71387.1 acyltransferase [Burkholderia ubonensis]KVP02081.1 acyltransferase [Burkholderia ubonensis]